MTDLPSRSSLQTQIRTLEEEITQARLVIKALEFGGEMSQAMEQRMILDGKVQELVQLRQDFVSVSGL